MARPMTLEELQAALRDAARPEGEGEGFLPTEIAEATGLKLDKVRDFIRLGLAKGTVTRGQRTAMRIDGKLAAVTSYIFLDPAA